MPPKLSETLNNELQERGWSMRELAKRAGVSHSLISQVLNEQAPASAEFCVKIAKALGQQAETWLQLGEILPPTPATVSDEQEMTSLWRHLDATIRQSIIAMMRSLLGFQPRNSISDPPARYEPAPRTLSERMAYQLLTELETMHPEDIQRVLDFMDKMKREGNGNGHPNEATVENL